MGLTDSCVILHSPPPMLCVGKRLISSDGCQADAIITSLMETPEGASLESFKAMDGAAVEAAVKGLEWPGLDSSQLAKVQQAVVEARDDGDGLVTLDEFIVAISTKEELRFIGDMFKWKVRNPRRLVRSWVAPLVLPDGGLRCAECERRQHGLTWAWLPLQSNFDRYDADRSGFVDSSELKEMMTEMNGDEGADNAHMQVHTNPPLPWRFLCDLLAAQSLCCCDLPAGVLGALRRGRGRSGLVVGVCDGDEETERVARRLSLPMAGHDADHDAMVCRACLRVSEHGAHVSCRNIKCVDRNFHSVATPALHVH